MKNTKYIAGTFLVTALLLSSAGAATADPGHGFLDHKVARLQDALKLSNEQADKIYAELKSVKEGKNCRDIETFSKRRVCKEEKHALIKEKISAVLTAEQRAEFAKIKEEHGKHCGWKKGRQDGTEADKAAK